MPLLKEWLPDAVGENHAAESNLPRRSLNRVRTQQWVDKRTAVQVAGFFGKSLTELFEAPEDVPLSSGMSPTASVTALADTVFACSEFDVIDTSAKALRSQRLADRESFFECLLMMEPAVSLLHDSRLPSHAQAVANYYLTLADQAQISNDRMIVGLASLFIEKALAASKKTSDFSLQATCLLHSASFRYSAEQFKEAAKDRSAAAQLITLIKDNAKKAALSTRLAGDRSRQMIEDQPAHAESMIKGAIEQANDLDDSCQKGSNLCHLGILHLRQKEIDAAADAFERAEKALLQSHSKNQPLQRAILSKWRALAEGASGANPEPFWRSATALSTDFGYSQQLKRISQMRSRVDEFGQRLI